jgi:MFS transporter, DHA2 family, multidrug resistance protein
LSELPESAFERTDLGALFVIGGAGLVFWEMRHPSPIVNFRPLRDRNFAISSLIISLSFAVLYGTSTLLPAFLESLFGYDAFHAGLVMSPSGVSAILALIVVGAFLGRRMDARWLIAAGLLILAAGNFWMSQLNLEFSLAGRLAASGHDSRRSPRFRTFIVAQVSAGVRSSCSRSC